MQRKSLGLCLTLFLAGGIAAPVVLAQAPLPQVEEAASSLKEPLESAVAQTPYSALVIHTRVDIEPLYPKKGASVGQDEYTEERAVYYARVLETFRGKTVQQVRYEVWGSVERRQLLTASPRY